METHEQRQHHRRRQLADSDPQPNNLNRLIGVLFTIFLFLAITYLILNSIWQCLRRFIQPPTTTTTSTSHTGRNPARMAQLQAMPVLIHEPVENNEKETCSVCLGEYQEGEEIRVLPQCKHLFHRACIDEWLLERSSFCPVCRARVIPIWLAVDGNGACMQRNSNNNHNNGNANANAIQRVEMYQGFNIMAHAHYPPFP